MEKNKTPYTVDVGRGAPIPVNPSSASTEGTSLMRICGSSFILRHEGKCYPMTISQHGPKALRIWSRHHSVDVVVRDEKDQLLESWGFDPSATTAERELLAPMPGLVLSIAVSPGQRVAAGDALLVLEAMKMENELRAEADCVVETILVTAGQAVGKKQVLMEFAS